MPAIYFLRLGRREDTGILYYLESLTDKQLEAEAESFKMFETLYRQIGSRENELNMKQLQMVIDTIRQSRQTKLKKVSTHTQALLK